MSAPKRLKLTEPGSAARPPSSTNSQSGPYDPTIAWKEYIQTSLDEIADVLSTCRDALPTEEEATESAASSSPGEMACPLFETHSVIQTAFGLLLDSTHAASIYLASKYRGNPTALTGAENFSAEQQNFYVNAQDKPWRHGLQADEEDYASEVATETGTQTSDDTDEGTDMSQRAGFDLPGPSAAETKRQVDSLPAAVKTARDLYQNAFEQLDQLKAHLQDSYKAASEAFPEPEGSSQSSLGIVDADKQDQLTHLHHQWLDKASEALTSVNEKCYFERVADAIATKDQYEDKRKLDYALDQVAHDAYARLTTGMLDRWREAGETREGGEISLAAIDSVIGHIGQRHDELQKKEVSERYYLLFGQHELSKSRPVEDENGLWSEWCAFFNGHHANWVTADIAQQRRPAHRLGPEDISQVF